MSNIISQIIYSTVHLSPSTPHHISTPFYPATLPLSIYSIYSPPSTYHSMLLYSSIHLHSAIHSISSILPSMSQRPTIQRLHHHHPHSHLITLLSRRHCVLFPVQTRRGSQLTTFLAAPSKVIPPAASASCLPLSASRRHITPGGPPASPIHHVTLRCSNFWLIFIFVSCDSL